MKGLVKCKVCKHRDESKMTGTCKVCSDNQMYTSRFVPDEIVKEVISYLGTEDPINYVNNSDPEGEAATWASK